MAWKIKQEFVQDGDIVEPSEWRINTNEMVSEINGFLDSDNIGGKSISTDLIKRDAFTTVLSNDDLPTKSYVFNHTTSGWHSFAHAVYNSEVGSGSFALEPSDGATPWEGTGLDSMPQVTFESDQDGLLNCEFSGWVQWLGTSSHPDFVDANPTPGAWNDKYSYYAKRNKYYKLKSAYILCSMWRITVNGSSVAESGPIGNEYTAHPIYLCGSVPILKSRDNIVQVQAQFVWYAPGRDDYIQASSWAPRLGSDNDQTLRRDCTLHCPTVLVTYRKR